MEEVKLGEHELDDENNGEAGDTSQWDLFPNVPKMAKQAPNNKSKAR